MVLFGDYLGIFSLSAFGPCGSRGKPYNVYYQLKALSYGLSSKRICSCHICQPVTAEQLASRNSDSDSDSPMLEAETVWNDNIS